MSKPKTIPFQKMLKTLDDLGYKFSSNKEQDFFIRTKCQLQQTEKNGKPIFVLYIDRVPVGMYS